MATVFLSPVGGAAAQFFGVGGLPLAAGTITTYAAGTTTPLATYTTSAGNVANSNPITLGIDGRVQNEIWLQSGSAYKFVVQDALSNVLGSYDNISGTNDFGSLTYTQGGTGSVTRTLQSKLQEIPTVQDFGADPTGNIDSTAAIQAALNSGALAVYIPPGTYLYSSLTMPLTFGFVLYGAGTASKLKCTGAGIKWPSSGTANCNYGEQYIKGLSISDNGTSTSHLIDTSYQGGVTLEDIFLGNLPVGFDGIHVDGNAASTGGDTYSHDVRIKNLQIYTNTAGRAGVYLGANSSDSTIDGYILNANNVTQYGIYCAGGAQSWSFENCHPYNTNKQIFFSTAPASGNALGFTFTNCTFDNPIGGTTDVAVINGFSGAIFEGCWFEAIKTGFSGLVITNSLATDIVSCRFTGASGSLYAVSETGTSNYTRVRGGSLSTAGNFTTPAFNLIGAESSVLGVNSPAPYGSAINFVGITSASIAAGSTVYLGPGGAQATAAIAAFVIPYPTGALISQAFIAWDTAPGAGSFTLSVVVNGVTVLASSAAITGSVFSTTINIPAGATQFVGQGNGVAIKLVTAAGSGVANFRYAILGTG